MSVKTHCSMPKVLVRVLIALTAVMTIAGCGGGGKKDGNSTPTNVGGGFTLKVSGGTLNDGSGANGLSVLATLRDSQGWGPVMPWTVTITGPSIPSYSPLVVEYADPRIGSYMSWEWQGFDPSAGVYRATATDGITTIFYDFTLNNTVIARPAPNGGVSGNDMTINWPSVAGAGSYAYEVCSPSATCYSAMTTSTSALVSFASLTAGSYLIQVNAYATDRLALTSGHSASPGLASQENVSSYLFSYPVGGNQDSGKYQLDAAGGILDFGLSGPGGPIYGLNIWTSIQDISAPGNPTAPAGDWNIVVTDPNGLVTNYIQPAGYGHFTNWYYGIEPVAGTYSVLATYGTASHSAVFSFSSVSPNLTPLLYSQISSSLVPNVTDPGIQDISMVWPAVTNAKSYYVSLWADVWNSVAKQYEYQAVWSDWVTAAGARVLNGDVPAGLTCDVYVTACQVDMTTTAPPDPAPSRADMSENYYGYPLPFTTP